MQANTYTGLTWNVNSDMRAKAGFAALSHRKWDEEHRAPLIQDTLDRIMTQYPRDVCFMHFQELRKCMTDEGKELNSLDPLVAHLEALGFACVSAPMNETPKAFWYVSAFHKRRFTILSYRTIFLHGSPHQALHSAKQDAFKAFTDKGEPVPQNVKDEWFERLGFGEFEASVLSCLVEDRASRLQFETWNFHAPVPAKQRIYATRRIAALLQQRAAEAEPTPVLLTGDFNSFPDWGGPEQHEIMNAVPCCTRLTKRLEVLKPDMQTVERVLPEGCGSYVSYPYDWGAAAANDPVVDKTMAALQDTKDPEQRRQLIQTCFDHMHATPTSKMPFFPMGGPIDQVYVIGRVFRAESQSATVIPSWLLPQETVGGDEPAEPVAFTPASLAYWTRNTPNGPILASDHQPILFSVECKYPPQMDLTAAAAAAASPADVAFTVAAAANCAFCSAVPAVTKWCSRCLAEAYCSVECQRKHWTATHRAECKELSSLRASDFASVVQKKGSNKRLARLLQLMTAFLDHKTCGSTIKHVAEIERGVRVVLTDACILVFIPKDLWQTYDHTLDKFLRMVDSYEADPFVAATAAVNTATAAVNTECWIATDQYAHVKLDFDMSRRAEESELRCYDPAVRAKAAATFARFNFIQNRQLYPESEYFTMRSFLEKPDMPRPHRARLGGEYRISY
jgi:hypothetical protein